MSWTFLLLKGLQSYLHLSISTFVDLEIVLMRLQFLADLPNYKNRLYLVPACCWALVVVKRMRYCKREVA